MARYEHLPIYRKSFELAVYLEHAVTGFARRHRYSLGTRLQGASQDVICRVIRAQNAPSKQRRADELRELRVEIEVLKNLLHLGKEVRAFASFNTYRHAAVLAVDVSRQAEGWLGSCGVSRKEPESRTAAPHGGRP